MDLLDVVTAPWAIEPAKLLEIRAIYETRLRGEKIDLAAVEEKLGRKLDNERAPYQLHGSVAMIPIVGVLAKRANLFTSISGGTSTQIAEAMLDDAAANQLVSSIVLEIDSPGGQVDGVQSLASKVQEVRASGKPVVAWISGVGASGAYWVASAAERVMIGDATTVVGSIGVVATHVDVSRREEQLGVKTTEITAGKYKRVASSYAPLSAEGRATIQSQVDEIYSVFVNAVAANRRVSVGKVLSSMADGRMFIGQQAVAAGLVDGVARIEKLIEDLRGREQIAVSTQGGTTMTMGKVITRRAFDAQTPHEQMAAVKAGCRVIEDGKTVAASASPLAQLEPGRRVITRKAFDALTPHEQMTAVKAGCYVVDDEKTVA